MAITRDAISGIRISGPSPQTMSFTCSGTNRYLVVWALDDSGDFITGYTYAGVSMTQLGKVTVGSFELYAYGLANPATGTNNIVGTASTGSVYIMAVSYNGVAQSTTPNAVSTGSGSSNPLTTTLITTVPNCWTVLVSQSTGGTQVASTGTHFLQSDGGSNNRNNGLYDSNGAISSAGSTSMVITIGAQTGTVMVALAPFVAPVANGNFFLAAAAQ